MAGGVATYAGGGFAPKGTDTVPAMLTPGEFVVNRKAANQNSGILNAINSGTQYFAAGGRVTDIGNYGSGPNNHRTLQLNAGTNLPTKWINCIQYFKQ